MKEKRCAGFSLGHLHMGEFVLPHMGGQVQGGLCHAKIEKYLKTIFVMINKDGGGVNFWILWGGHSCYEGGHRAHRVPSRPPPLEKTLMCHTTRLTKFVTSRPIINIRIFL